MRFWFRLDMKRISIRPFYFYHEGKRIFRLPWFLFYSVIADAEHHFVHIYIYIFYAVRILKTLVTTIVEPGIENRGDVERPEPEWERVKGENAITNAYESLI